MKSINAMLLIARLPLRQSAPIPTWFEPESPMNKTTRLTRIAFITVLLLATLTSLHCGRRATFETRSSLSPISIAAASCIARAIPWPRRLRSTGWRPRVCGLIAPILRGRSACRRGWRSSQAATRTVAACTETTPSCCKPTIADYLRPAAMLNPQTSQPWQTAHETFFWTLALSCGTGSSGAVDGPAADNTLPPCSWPSPTARI